MNDRQIPMYWVVFFLPMLAIVIAGWIMMDLGPLSTAVYFGVVALVVIAVMVEALARNLPHTLQEQAKANCYRFDGSESSRRAAAEEKAKRKLRTDLWAIGVICLLVGGMTTAAINFYVVPIQVAARGLTSFSVDPVQWKSNMKEQRVDRDLESMLGSEYRVSPRDANKAARTLWQLAPFLLIGLLAGGAGMIYFANRGYRRALADYHQGLIARQAKAAERDVLHIQHHEERLARRATESST
ncbi:MAG: hypothetical protein Aurels2KO_06650 [Aureliella sp.]